MLRERVEQQIDEVLSPLFDALAAERSVVVGNGPGAYVTSVPDVPTRLAAVRELLDRSYGRPRQEIEHQGPAAEALASSFALSAEDREALAGVLRARPIAQPE